MDLPLTPPSLQDLLEESKSPPLQLLLERRPLVGGEYLHWDNLRHREPPVGLSTREWWLAIKLARSGARENIPLLDKRGDHFGLVYATPIRRALQRVDQGLGVLGTGSSIEGLVDQHGREYLVSNSLMEEAIRSSQLEGASTTRAKAKDMLREQRPPRDRGEKMILNNFHAMERIEELATGPLTIDRVFELHRILMDGTLDHPEKSGVFRTAQDNVVVELLHSIETAHVPPDARELPTRMNRLLEFANGDTPDEWLHPVLRAIILHFMIGYDHPFVDGNGRVARALFYWALARHGYPLAKFLSISKVLRDAPAKYARAYLHTETDDGDLTYFVDHQLGVMLQSMEALTQYVSRKAAGTKELEVALRSFGELNHRQVRLLGHALRNPGFTYTVRSHQNSNGVVNATARADLLDLAKKDLLVQGKRGREFVFVAPRELESRIQSRRPPRTEALASAMTE